MIERRKLVFLTISVIAMLTILGSAVLGQTADRTGIYRYLSIFSEVYSLIRSSYVDEVESDKLVEGAFAGVTDAIDEFSYYVPPQQRKEFDASRNFAAGADTGLVVSRRFGYAYVIATVPGSPSEKAGVLPGDFLEQIDGRPTEKMPVWQLEAALRNSGKPLILNILRGGMARREKVTIQPVQWKPEALSSKYYGSVAYIRVPTFGEGTARALGESLDAAKKSGHKKLIVDVRGNSTGSIEEAVLGADVFLAKGVITTIVGRRAEGKRWDADDKTSYEGELEVLTDTSTSAAAEVFAAAIRDNKRGRVIGLTTYGKAIVQKFVPLPSGGGLFMTIGHYTTPELTPIKEQGIKPDVVVDVAVASIEEETPEKKDVKKDDPILRKALSLFGEVDKTMEPVKAAA